MSKIKVGAVNYLNTKPLIYGFLEGGMKNEMELIQDYPARIAHLLLSNSIDVGLVPIAVLAALPKAFIICDYCIGCNGPVASVGLFSDVPITEIKSVLLDYQSRTSVRLAKILLKEYWKIEPDLIAAAEDYRAHIKGSVAGLVIGDRAFEQRKISKYMYDLGEAWQLHTGLPFVFAAWLSSKRLDEKFIEMFNSTTGAGLKHLDVILQNTPYVLCDLEEYYTKNISYHLTDDKKKGMNLFLEKIKQYGL